MEEYRLVWIQRDGLVFSSLIRSKWLEDANNILVLEGRVVEWWPFEA